MAKKKTGGTVVAPAVKLIERIRDWVRERLGDPNAHSLENCLKEFSDQAESTVKAYHFQARKELGLVRARGTTGPRTSGNPEGPVTFEELMGVQELNKDQDLDQILATVEMVQLKFGTPTRARQVIESFRLLHGKK